jgi:hypothetical protein
MIVGCYAMDLYCDNADQTGARGYAFHSFAKAVAGPEQFIGETYGECAAKARKRGWKLVGKFGKAYCPTCNGKKQPAA